MAYLAPLLLWLCPVCTAVFRQPSDRHWARTAVSQCQTGNPTGSRTCTILPHWSRPQNPACRYADPWHTRPHLLTDIPPAQTVLYINSFVLTRVEYLTFQFAFQSAYASFEGFHSVVVEDSRSCWMSRRISSSRCFERHGAVIFEGSLSVEIKAAHSLEMVGTTDGIRKYKIKRFKLYIYPPFSYGCETWLDNKG